MKTRNIAIVATAILLLATTVISTSASIHAVFATYNRNQATSQANACGNEFMATNVGCQSADSQIQGDKNTAAISSQQTFPEVEREKDHQRDHHKPIPPPTEDTCAADYVWDLTLNQPLLELPAGTVLCSFSDVLNVREDVQIGGTGEELPYPVIITQPSASTGLCEAGFSDATASSGNPPPPVEIEDAVCVTPGIP